MKSRLLNHINEVRDFIQSIENDYNPEFTITFISRLIENILQTPDNDFDRQKDMINANLCVIAKHPTLFDSRYQMHGPTSLVMHNGEKYVITAHDHAFKYDYTLEYIQDMHAMNEKKYKDAKHMIYDKVADELAEFVYGLQQEGKIWCPYWPVVPIRFADQNTFQPKLCFKTRYGLFEPKK